MRIVTQLMVESAILSLIGAGLGLGLAAGIDRVLISFLPPSNNPATLSAMPDTRILLFTLLVSAATAVLFGLAPALQSTKPDVAPTLKDQARVDLLRRRGWLFRKTLVSAQVMFSLLLLVAAGLFTRSLKNLKSLDPGFDTGKLLTFNVNPSVDGYKAAQSVEFFRRLKEQLDATPGVESSRLPSWAVLTGNEWDSSMTVAGYTASPGEEIDPHMNYISPDYFRTFGIPLLQGRDFAVADGATSPPVAVVNERFAKRYFGNQNPIGRHIGMGGDPGTKTPIEIVGVARDTKYETMRDEVPVEVYLPRRAGILLRIPANERVYPRQRRAGQHAAGDAAGRRAGRHGCPD